MSISKTLATVGCLIAAWTLAGCTERESVLEKAQADDVSTVPDNDPAMADAFKKAKSSLDQFLALAASPPPNTDSYAVKVAIQDGDQTEYFWISPFTATGESFSGQVNNTPRLVGNVREGETISFKRADVVDWTYEAEGKMHGNFTACALLKHESPEDAAQFMAQYGLDCKT